MTAPKIIAFYLPQFHQIPENDLWWGVGFTEWVNVKKAKPLFQNHLQPRKPINSNYYNLLDDNVIREQAILARNYGVDGFCFYHYWFGGHLLLEKPAEKLLVNKDIDIEFSFSWANEHWTNAWVSNENKVLIEQNYGNEQEWINHFNYLLPFFKDKRYIKKENKPLFTIYRPELIDSLKDMITLWQKLSIQNGFDGIFITYQHPSYYLNPRRDDDLFDGNIEYQPTYAQALMNNNKYRLLKYIKRRVSVFFERKLKLNLESISNRKLRTYDYDEVWRYILKMKPSSKKSIPGAFVDWDNTPRRGYNGIVYLRSSPQKFETYFKMLLQKNFYEYKSDFIFIFSWNEWAEGGYLEPDEHNKYGYLEAIKNSLENYKGMI